jgi:phage gp29-like protein
MNIFNLFKTEKTSTIKNVPIGAVAVRNSNNYYTTQSNILENPNKILEDLEKTTSDLRYLLYDAHIYSVVQSRKSAVLSKEWELLTDDKEVKEFIEANLNKIELRKVIAEILDAPLYGYKPIELFWGLDGDRIILSSAIGKPAYWFAFDKLNRLMFINDNAQYEMLPSKKFVVAQYNPTYDNPYGDSILSNCLRPYMFKRGAMQLWSEFVEKYGTPFLIGKADSSIDLTQLSALNDILASAKRSFTMATSDSFNIQTLETDRSSANATYLTFIHFLNSEISKAVLSQTLTTEQGDTGSYSMSQTHLQVRKDITDADTQLVENTIQKIINYLIDFNFEGKAYPTFRMYEEEDVDMTLAQRDQILSQIIEFTPDYIKANYGLKDNDFKMKTAPTFAESTTIERNPLNEYADKVINFAVENFRKGTSYQNILDGIYDMFPNLPDQEIEGYLSNAIFIAKSGSYIDNKA